MRADADDRRRNSMRRRLIVLVVLTALALAAVTYPREVLIGAGALIGCAAVAVAVYCFAWVLAGLLAREEVERHG